MGEGCEAIRVRLGRNLRRLRSLAGLSLEQVGERLGVTSQQVQKYENGTNNVSVAALCRLRAILGCGFEDFFVGLDGDATGGGAEAGDFRRRPAYRLAQAVLEISNAEVQEQLIRFAQTLAGRV